jgi:acyl carrier protein
MPVVTMEDITKLVGLQLGIRKVGFQDRFLEDLGAESADVANLVAAVEEKYQIKMGESEIAKVLTAADLFALVRKHVT